MINKTIIVKEEKTITLDSDLLYTEIEETIHNKFAELYQIIGVEDGDISPEQNIALKNSIDNIYTLMIESAEQNKPQNTKLMWLTWN